MPGVLPAGVGRGGGGGSACCPREPSPSPPRSILETQIKYVSLPRPGSHCFTDIFGVLSQRPKAQLPSTKATLVAFTAPAGGCQAVPQPWVAASWQAGTQHPGWSPRPLWRWMGCLLPLQPEAAHPCEEHSRLWHPFGVTPWGRCWGMGWGGGHGAGPQRAQPATPAGAPGDPQPKQAVAGGQEAQHLPQGSASLGGRR